MKKIIGILIGIFMFVTSICYGQIPLDCNGPKPCKSKLISFVFNNATSKSVEVSGPGIIMTIVVALPSGFTGTDGVLTISNEDGYDVYNSYSYTGNYMTGDNVYILEMNTPIVRTNVVTLSFGSAQSGQADLSIYLKGGN
jgi:hypothetical protein